jgi:hypothetical protein
VTAENKTRKSVEEVLASLKEKQKALSLKAAKLEKAIEEKKTSAQRAKRVRIGNLAAEAGILDVSDEILKTWFGEIALKHTNC